MRLFSHCFLILCGFALAQKNYWVVFTDKGIAGKSMNWQDIARQSISARSIMRRYEMGIMLDWTDIPVPEEYIRAVENCGGKLRAVSKWLCSASFTLGEDAKNRVLNLPFVREIRPVAVMRRIEPRATKGIHMPTDEFYGSAYFQNKLVGADFMHRLGYFGDGVLIGFLDSGFRITVSAFDSMIIQGRIVATRDFIHGDDSVDYQAGDFDLSGYLHGTMTLSCVSALSPGTDGMVGVAPYAQVALAKTEIVDSLGVAFERQIEEDFWVAGIEWLDSVGVDIVSSSLGYFDFDGTAYTFSQLDGDFPLATRAADLAVSKGIAVFNSAGNDRLRTGHIVIPADGDSVCAVGGTNRYGWYAWFSSPGPTADGRIKPDISTFADGVTVWDPDLNKRSTASGTSFSCPLVAGASALIMQARRQMGIPLSGYEIIQRLKETADQGDSPDNNFGWGIPCVPVAAGLAGGVRGIVLGVSGDTIRNAVVTLKFGESTYTDTTDRRGRYYIYFTSETARVSVNIPGYISQSRQVNVPLGEVVSVDFTMIRADTTKDIICFPNPFEDKLYIRWFDCSETPYIRIYNTNGELIYFTKENDDDCIFEWNGENQKGQDVSSGIYFIIWDNGTTRREFKVLRAN